MEVHAHTHTPRKKWTHYLWEFLMLFLAVFCGFLAENFREHQIEHQREKKYMGSLLSDLRDDSYYMDFCSGAIPGQISGLDSLITALRQPLSIKRNINAVYLMYIRYGQGGYSAEFTEGTTAQLKNAGGLRMIRSDSIVSLFNSYEGLKVVVKRNESLYLSALIAIEQDHANHLLDLTAPTMINSMINDINSWKMNTDSILSMAEKDNPVILKDLTTNIDVFRNYIKSLKSLTENFLFFINQCNKLNILLQASIKKEYHLK